jgi:hypothetical protein
MVKIPDQHWTIPPLENGDRLNRYEFERRYSAMPNLRNISTYLLIAMELYEVEFFQGCG